MVDISRALSIRGWMTEKELLYLADIASKSRLVVEIGSFAGRSARAMADNLHSGCVLFCVDPYLRYNGTPVILDNLGKANEAYLEFTENLSDKLEDGTVILIRNHSVIAAEQFPFSPDFVFIDGDHSYKSVIDDINSWYSKIQSGGTLAGHDFNVHEGVNQAVNEKFNNRYELPVGSIWSVKV